MNSLEKKLIEQTSKLTHAADGDWNYWVHSTDYVQWKKLFFCGPMGGIQQLAGRELYVSDNAPLFFKICLQVHELSVELDARAMVLYGLHRSLLERMKKPVEKSLPTWLHEELVNKQRNALIPEDFHWYLNPLTISNLQKENAGVLDAGLKMLHPDDTTFMLHGYRVRTDPDAPDGSHVDIVQHSLEMTNIDHDWYQMWARRWKVDRKTAKYALCLYVYGPQQAGEKECIKRHYNNLVAGGKEVEGVGPWDYEAKDILEAKGIHPKWRQTIDGHWDARCMLYPHQSKRIIDTNLARLKAAIEEGSQQRTLHQLSVLLTNVLRYMVKK